MSKEDESDSKNGSKKKDSDKVDDLGKVVGEVINTGAGAGADKGAVKKLIEKTRGIEDEPDLFLSEPSKPGVKKDFAEAKKIVETAKLTDGLQDKEKEKRDSYVPDKSKEYKPEPGSVLTDQPEKPKEQENPEEKYKKHRDEEEES
jgi:hypothetical protein